jgi:hypothetical protein
MHLQMPPLAVPANLFGRQPQMKPSIILGPYILPTHAPEIAATEIAPLGFAIEWASPSGARRSSLFRHRPAHAPHRIRLENLVVPAEQLPFSIECPEYQVVHTEKHIFVPSESLLLRLYRTHDVRRPVSDVLRELASCVPLHSAVTRPISASGLLASAVEERGYRLHSLLPSCRQLIAEIAWKSPGVDYRYHVCLCAFGDGHDGGEWMKPGLIGVSLLLSEELRRLVHGPPVTLFSAAGVRLLEAQLPKPAVAGTLK